MHSDTQLVQEMVASYMREPGGSTMDSAFTHVLEVVRAHDDASGSIAARFVVLRRVLLEIHSELSSPDEPPPTRALLLRELEEGLKAVCGVGA